MPNEERQDKDRMEAERPQGAKGCQMHGIKREGEAGLVLTIPGNGTMAKKERKMVM